MSNFSNHLYDDDVYYNNNTFYINTWYIDRTGDINMDDITNNDILYNVVLDTHSADGTYIEIDTDIDTHLNIRMFYNETFTIYDYISYHSMNNNQSNLQFIFEDCHITENDQNCPICMETKEPTHICRLNCKHSFCHHCICQYMERNQQYSTCPLCRHLITSLHIHQT